jgi:hypothetical protein
VCYAHSGDVAIAYQAFGEGSVDLVCQHCQSWGDAGYTAHQTSSGAR